MLGFFLSFLIAIVLFDGGKGLLLLMIYVALVQALSLKKAPVARSSFVLSLRSSRFLLISGLVTLAYFTLSLRWGLSSSPPFLKAAQLTLIYLGGMFCILTSSSEAPPLPSFLAPICLRAYCLLVFFLGLEVILRFFHCSVFHLWHPIDITQRFSLLTKSGLFSVLFFWPSMMCLFLRKNRAIFASPSNFSRWRAWKLVGSVALGLVCMSYFFHMDVILIALGVSFGVFSVLLVCPRLFSYILSLGVLVPVGVPLFMKPFFTWAFSESSFFCMPASWQHRFHIWNFVTHRIWEKPLLGWGLESSRLLAHAPTTLDFIEGSTSFSLHGTDVLLPLHPHNGFLQLWLEGGLVGVTLFLIFLGILLKSLSKIFPHPLSKALVGASITSCLIPFSISYGIWQSWWVASLFALAWYWRIQVNSIKQNA